MLTPAQQLTGWIADHQLSEDGSVSLARLRRCHEQVAARQRSPTDHVSEPCPASALAELDGLRSRATIQPYLEDGWELCVVDFHQVLAAQPHVRVDTMPGEEDSSRIGDITLPSHSRSQVRTQYDAATRTWVFTSADPNLDVMSEFAGELDDGVTGVGFVVQAQPSMMQVVHWRDRLVLRDGYHRAYNLLRRGVRHAPVLMSKREEHLPPSGPGMLTAETLAARFPPFLDDFLNDTVSDRVAIPRTQKAVTIIASSFPVVDAH